MRLSRLATILVLTMGAMVRLRAQCPTLALPVTTPGGTSQNGIVFDIDNISTAEVRISGFSVFGIAPSVSDFNLYRLNATGSYLANSTNVRTPANWTLIGTSLGVAMQTTLTEVPAVLDVAIAPGTTRAFYVTSTNSNLVSYTVGSTPPNVLGGIIANNGTIRVRGGNGVVYPFGGPSGTIFGGATIGTSGRLFRGQVRYSTSTTPGWQLNHPNAALDLNGALASPCEGAHLRSCDGALVTLTTATALAGSPFELAYSILASVARGAGGSVTTGGQIINLDLSGSIHFLHGVTVPLLLPHPGAVGIPFSMPTGLTVTAQLAVLDPAHSEGVRFSQAGEVVGFPIGGTALGPTDDDSATLLVQTEVPLCGVALDFYGTTYTQVQFISNGRILLGTVADISFTPTLSEALSGRPFAGGWLDLNPAAGGTCDAAAGDLNALDPSLAAALYPGQGVLPAACWRWANVPLFGTTIPVDHRLYFVRPPTAASGAWIYRSFLSPFGTSALQSMLVGLCPGLGATNPGLSNFAVGASGLSPNPPTDMLYNLGVAATTNLLLGANTLLFTPISGNSANGYSWSGFNLP